jgi:hypothetical protein
MNADFWAAEKVLSWGIKPEEIAERMAALALNTWV